MSHNFRLSVTQLKCYMVKQNKFCLSVTRRWMLKILQKKFCLSVTEQNFINKGNVYVFVCLWPLTLWNSLFFLFKCSIYEKSISQKSEDRLCPWETPNLWKVNLSNPKIIYWFIVVCVLFNAMLLAPHIKYF